MYRPNTSASASTLKPSLILLSVGLAVLLFLAGVPVYAFAQSDATPTAVSEEEPATLHTAAIQFLLLGESIPAYLRPEAVVATALLDTGVGYSGDTRVFGYAERYADWIGGAAGMPVNFVSFASNDPMTAAGLLAEIQRDEAIRDAITRSDVILVGAPTGDLPWVSETDSCNRDADDWSLYSDECADEVVLGVRPILEEIYSEIAALRAGNPTVLRTTNLINNAIGRYSRSGDPGEATQTVLDKWNPALCEVANAGGFVCADLYQRFNGDDGRQAAGDLLYYGDTKALSEKGGETVASELIDTGYAELFAAGVREHPFAGQDVWLAAIMDYHGAPPEGDWWAEVWLMRPDGTEAHPIDTQLPHTAYKIDWKPDGSKLVISTNGEMPRLYEYDIATGELSRPVECADECIEDWDPAYSPDGSQIVFIRDYGVLRPATGPGYYEAPDRCPVVIADIGSGEVTEVAEHLQGSGFCDYPWEPDWSPDGTQIVYWMSPLDEDGEPAGSRIHIVNADGTDDHAITDPALNASAATWSPDGEWILFGTHSVDEYAVDEVVSNIYRVRPDGTDLEQLTFFETHQIRGVTPRYSPDGKWIFFTGQVRPGKQLWAMPADGGEPIHIRRGSTLDWLRPALQPNPIESDATPTAVPEEESTADATPEPEVEVAEQVLAPTMEPTPAPLRMVVLGDRISAYTPGYVAPFDYASRFADWVANATGRRVDLRNFSSLLAPGLQGALDQTDVDGTYYGALAGSRFVVITAAQNSAPWLRDDDACDGDAIETDWSTYTDECIAEDVTAFQEELAALLELISEARDGAPTAVRVLNRYNEMLVSPAEGGALSEAEVLQNNVTIAYHDALNMAICETAQAHGALCADLYHRFNGAEGDRAMGELLYDFDASRLSEKGSEVIVSVLIDLGYGELLEDGIAQHPLAGMNGWIATGFGYEGINGSDMEGSFRNEIWLMRPDGTGAHEIASDIPWSQAKHDWSPDGTKLVMGVIGDEIGIWEYDVASGASSRLFDCVDPCAEDWEPDYSPDGTKVAFVRGLGDFVYNPEYDGDMPTSCGVAVGEIETGDVVLINSVTTASGGCSYPWEPRWSPDGAQIAYWASEYADGELLGTSVWLINADGTEERQLTPPGFIAGEPDWSPDGEWIIFASYPLEEYGGPYISNLYRIRPDGSDMEQLTYYEDDMIRAVSPHYTPDGELVLFTARTRPGMRLWAMPANGGETIPIRRGVSVDWSFGMLQPMVEAE